MTTPFHVLVKPGGARCNLDCSYCFYLEKEKLYPGASAPVMSRQLLESHVRQTIAASPGPEVGFAWQGGEPTLLGVDFFRRAVELQGRYAEGKQITNAIQTNGVLLNDEWGQFLSEYRFLVGLSVDGPAHLHDAYRPDKGGKGSFRRVMAGLEILQRHRVEFNTLTVVHRDNADHAREIYDFLVDCGSRFFQFIPLVERFSSQPVPSGLERSVGEGPGTVHPRSILPEQWGQFLCSIFDHWVRHDVGTVFVQLFEVALQSYLGIPQSLCLFRETCGQAVALEHTGDLYSCDHYVFPENRLGNILEQPLESLLTSPQQVEFGQAKKNRLPAYCQRCEVRRACNGECPKNRFTLTPDGEPGLNYLCQGYKRFFLHVQPYMHFMAQCLQSRRPPTEVMRFAASQSGGAS